MHQFFRLKVRAHCCMLVGQRAGILLPATSDCDVVGSLSVGNGGAPVAVTKPEQGTMRLHDAGEIWVGATPVAPVLYQLQVRPRTAAYGSSRSRARTKEHLEVRGTLLRTGRDWRGLRERRGQELWLYLRGGRRL